MLMIHEVPRAMRADDNFIRTYTGRKFWPLNPRAYEVNIEDIAHPLSQICRWIGHTRLFYSVAEHSLRVSWLAEVLWLECSERVNRKERIAYAREVGLWGLLHDASEAYLCDLPSPLKHAGPLGDLYRAYEKRLMSAIAERFELIPHEPTFISQADRILLNTEARDLMICPAPPHRNVGELPSRIVPMSAQAAKEGFLNRFLSLTMARKTEHQIIQ
jgi:uncharacterized protein